jgi:Fuc2NAc and GlcNAc transferase
MFLGGAGAWLVVRWGSGFGLLDKANHRSSHKGVVPKGGGIGILAAFLLA